MGVFFCWLPAGATLLLATWAFELMPQGMPHRGPDMSPRDTCLLAFSNEATGSEWSKPFALGLCGALCCCRPVHPATTAAYASPPSVGPRLLEAWTGRLLFVATAGLPALLWLAGRACKNSTANDYWLVAADVACKGLFLNTWDVPAWKLYAQCDQNKCDRYSGITLFKLYIKRTIKYNILTVYEEK